MKQLKHIILIILLMSIAFADNQPMRAFSTDASDVDTTADTLAVQMDSAINQFVGCRAMAGATVGICVMDIRTGKPVASYNLEHQLIPASVMKLVTSASALKQLTKNFTLRTRVKLTGAVDEDGVLNGDIIVEGGLDPTLDSKHFPDRDSFVALAVENILDLGIKTINGTIRAEEKIQPKDAVPDDWDDGDVAEDYGAGIYSINYNDNLFSLIIDTSTGVAQVVDTVPHLQNLEIENRMSVTARGRFSPIIHRKKNTNKVVLSGVLRKINDPIEAITTMPHPAEGLIADIRETLEGEGVTIHDKKVKTSGETTQVMSYESPLLPDILRSLLYRSDNMYAECMQRRVGESLCGEPTRENGVKAITRILKQWNVPTNGVTLYDGSGLSRSNRITPQFLANVLSAAARDWQTRDVFPTLVPKCGVDGTVRNLLKGTWLAGNICLKSGSMTGVRSYAGYFPASKPKYAVVLMTNGFHCNYDQLLTSISRLMLGLFDNCQNLIDNQ